MIVFEFVVLVDFCEGVEQKIIFRCLFVGGGGYLGIQINVMGIGGYIFGILVYLVGVLIYFMVEGVENGW